MDVPVGLRAGLARKYKNDLIAAKALNLDFRVIRTKADYVPEYLILAGESTPVTQILKKPTTLWLNTADNRWRRYFKDQWEVIPTPCETAKHSHPLSSTIHLYYHPSWPNPLWLPPSGFRRKLGEQRPRNRENGWAQFLYERWEALGKKSTFEEDLQGVLQIFLRNKDPIPAFDLLQTAGMFEDGNPPTLDSAINTLHGLSDTKFQCGFTHSGDGRDKHLSIEYFRKLFMNPTNCPRDVILPDVYAHRIPAQSSLSEVNLKLPFHLRDKGRLIPDRSLPGSPIIQEVVYTTRGQLTATHCNATSATQIVIHVHGPKLWLKWPCNHHNRKYLEKLWLSQEKTLHNGSILKAIQTLTGMSARLVEEPLTCFYLSPAEIYASISFGRCVHISVNFVHTDNFRETFQLGRFYNQLLHDAVAQVEKEESESVYSREDLKAPELYVAQSSQLVEWWMHLRNLGTEESMQQSIEVATRAKAFNSIWKRLGGRVSESVMHQLSDECGKAFKKMLGS